MRKLIANLKPWTGLGIKEVEKAGERIVDTLHRSNPWDDTDCRRKECLPCSGSFKKENKKFLNCTRHSVLYMTWC